MNTNDIRKKIEEMPPEPIQGILIVNTKDGMSRIWFKGCSRNPDEIKIDGNVTAIDWKREVSEGDKIQIGFGIPENCILRKDALALIPKDHVCLSKKDLLTEANIWFLMHGYNPECKEPDCRCATVGEKLKALSVKRNKTGRS